MLSQIKTDSKLLEKKSEDWFEWLSWGEKEEEIPQNHMKAEKEVTEPKNLPLSNNKKKITDYSINLLPINEEETKHQIQRNRLTDKLKNLDDIKFKNSFARRNSPKKIFQPLSTLTEDNREMGAFNFNSLQDIPLPIMNLEERVKSIDLESATMDTGEISPQKLSDKVKKIDKQMYNFK